MNKNTNQRVRDINGAINKINYLHEEHIYVRLDTLGSGEGFIEMNESDYNRLYEEKLERLEGIYYSMTEDMVYDEDEFKEEDSDIPKEQETKVHETNESYIRMLNKTTGDILFSRRPLIEKLFLIIVMSIFKRALQIIEAARKYKDSFVRRAKEKQVMCQRAVAVADKYKIYSLDEGNLRIKELNLKILKSKNHSEISEAKKQLSEIKRDFIPFMKTEFKKELGRMSKGYSDVSARYEKEVERHAELIASKYEKIIAEANREIRNKNVIPKVGKEELKEIIDCLRWEKSMIIRVDKCDESLGHTFNVKGMPKDIVAEGIENRKRNNKPIPKRQGITKVQNGNMRFMEEIIFQPDPRDKFMPSDVSAMTKEFAGKIGLEKYVCDMVVHTDHFAGIDTKTGKGYNMHLSEEIRTQFPQMVNAHILFDTMSYNDDRYGKSRAFQLGDNGLMMDEKMKAEYEVMLKHGGFHTIMHNRYFQKKVLPRMDMKGNLEDIIRLGCITGAIPIMENGDGTFLVNKKSVVKADDFAEAIEKTMKGLSAVCKLEDSYIVQLINDVNRILSEESKRSDSWKNIPKRPFRDNAVIFRRETEETLSQISDLKKFWQDNRNNMPLLRDKLRNDIQDILQAHPINDKQFFELLNEKGYHYEQKKRSGTKYIYICPEKDYKTKGLPAISLNDLDRIGTERLDTYSWKNIVATFTENRKEISQNTSYYDLISRIDIILKEEERLNTNEPGVKLEKSEERKAKGGPGLEIER